MLHRFGPFELDERRFELRRSGKPVAVQRLVLETIAYFVKNPDRLISKDELIQGPWKGTSVSDAALAQVIMVARKAIAHRGQRWAVIETVRAKGYRFVAEVTSHLPERPLGRETTSRVASATPERVNGAAFFGREEQVEALLSAARRAAKGNGNLVLIAGEPGIGKTSLLEHFAHVAPDVEVLWGHCWEAGGAPAFWPWLEMVRGFIDRHGDGAIAMMGSEASEIVEWLPEIRPHVPYSRTPSRDHGSPQARFRVFDAVTRFLSRAANRHPLALLIDDLHAADDTAILLLQFISRTLSTTRLIVVASYRDLEVRTRPVLSAFLSGPSPSATTITLQGLREPDVAALLELRVGQTFPAESVHKILKVTNGNPFLVGELARTLVASGSDRQIDLSHLSFFRVPDRVAEIVRKHLQHLPGPTVSALSTASVIGREFALPLLRGLCGGTPESGIGELEPALEEGIIEQSIGDSRVFSFSHALIRETLYHELPPVRRCSLHFSAGELLERQQASDCAAAFQIAHHYFSAAAHKGADKALEWALKAAQRAREIFAYEQAAEHYGRALSALDLMGHDERRACEILLSLADAQRLLGQSAESVATLRRVEDAARAHGFAELVARAALGCAEAMRDALPTDEAMRRRIEQALQMLPEGDQPLRARLMGALSLSALFTMSVDERLGLTEKAISMARRLGDDDTLASVLYFCGHSLSQSHHLDRAISLGAEMIQLARRAHNVDRLLDALLYQAGHLLIKGRHLDADSELREHAKVAAESRHALHMWWTRVASCAKASIMGKIELAEKLAREGLALGQPLVGIAAEGMFGSQLLVLGVEKEGEDSLRIMEEAADIGRKFQSQLPGFRTWESCLALAQFELGLADDARATFDRIAVEGFDKIPDDLHRLTRLVFLTRIARGLHDAPRARSLHHELMPLCGRHVMVSLLGAYGGPVSYHLGSLAVTMGETNMAMSHFSAAIAESKAIGSPNWEAWAEYELGGILSNSKRADESKRGLELVRNALGMARQLELSRLERKAKEILHELM